jgi:alkylation response protein AidB-like acyl-CoA dehydrogenase
VTGLARTTEQDDLRGAVRESLTALAGARASREPDSPVEAYDERAWRTLMDDFGAGGIAVPEGLGGAGYGLGELSVIFEEAGRGLAKIPLLATLGLALPLLGRCAGADADEAVGRIAAGTSIATVAVDTLAWPAADLTPAVGARLDGGWRLDGTVDSVAFGHLADVTLVPARDPGGGTGIFLAERGPGIDARADVTLDLTQPTARVRFTAAPARRLEVRGDAGAEDATGGDAAAAVRHAVSYASACLAADSLGGAQACLDASVGYAKIRSQFGRSIGSFQAIKHMLADVAIEVRRAEGLVMAVATGGEGGALFGLDAAVAKAAASEAYLLASRENIQVHGGIGFTWELDAHHYLKRATTNDLTFGDVRAQRSLIAAILRDGIAGDAPQLARR